MPAKPKSPAPAWAYSAVASIAEELFSLVQRNKGNAAANDCFAGADHDALAQLLMSHVPESVQEPVPAVISSGFGKPAPAPSSGFSAPAAPRPAAMKQNTRPLATTILKMLTKSRRRQNITMLAAKLNQSADTVRLAVNSRGSGLVMKGDWVEIGENSES